MWFNFSSLCLQPKWLGVTIRSYDIAPPRILTVTEACNEKSIKKTETAKQSNRDPSLRGFFTSKTVDFTGFLLFFVKWDPLLRIFWSKMGPISKDFWWKSNSFGQGSIPVYHVTNQRPDEIWSFQTQRSQSELQILISSIWFNLIVIIFPLDE